MRCAKCAEIRSDELFCAGSHLLQHSMAALKASADAGCDFCTLCWASIAQRYDEKHLDCLLRGLDTDGKEISDTDVYLNGFVYPAPPYTRISEKSAKGIRNAVWIELGLIGNNTLAELTIFADPGTPAARQFGETWTTVDRNPGLHIDFTRRWMGECRAKHKLCSSHFLSSEKSEMPTRLIDVGDSRDKRPPRLVVWRKSEIQAPYLALSYCWGTSLNSTMLREDNLHELQLHIDEEQLPKSHRDAFQLARDLGFRYVWIDALCIVQGNREDWEYESKRMAQVYGNAALTVIAGRAADSRDGFLENRLRHSAGPCAINFYGEGRNQGLPRSKIRKLGEIWISLPRSPRYGPVSERGWCFQEEILSCRALVFGEEQLTFRCQELEIREDGGASRPIAYRIRSSYDHAFAPVGPDSEPLGPRELDDEELARRWRIFWYSGVVWHYPARQITNQDDVFAAISGLAQMAKAKIRSRYLAGLWEVDMVRGLLWQVPKSMQRRRRATVVSQSGTEGQVIPVEVPSWSWAVIQGRVEIDFVSRNEAKYHESNWLVRPKYQGRWTRDPICHATSVHIKSCELEFFGRPRRVKCRRGKTQSMNPKRPETSGYSVHLLPIGEDEVGPEEVEDHDNNPSSEAPSHVVASGVFDVAKERVGSCWCLPLTKTAGLLVVRHERGWFRRLGIMKILDLDWMMSAQEEEVRLV